MARLLCLFAALVSHQHMCNVQAVVLRGSMSIGNGSATNGSTLATPASDPDASFLQAGRNRIHLIDPTESAVEKLDLEEAFGHTTGDDVWRASSDDSIENEGDHPAELSSDSTEQGDDDVEASSKPMPSSADNAEEHSANDVGVDSHANDGDAPDVQTESLVSKTQERPGDLADAELERLELQQDLGIADEDSHPVNGESGRPVLGPDEAIQVHADSDGMDAMPQGDSEAEMAKLEAFQESRKDQIDTDAGLVLMRTASDIKATNVPEEENVEPDDELGSSPLGAFLQTNSKMENIDEDYDDVTAELERVQLEDLGVPDDGSELTAADEKETTDADEDDKADFDELARKADEDEKVELASEVDLSSSDGSSDSQHSESEDEENAADGDSEAWNAKFEAALDSPDMQ